MQYSLECPKLNSLPNHFKAIIYHNPASTCGKIKLGRPTGLDSVFIQTNALGSESFPNWAGRGAIYIPVGWFHGTDSHLPNSQDAAFSPQWCRCPRTGLPNRHWPLGFSDDFSHKHPSGDALIHDPIMDGSNHTLTNPPAILRHGLQWHQDRTAETSTLS